MTYHSVGLTRAGEVATLTLSAKMGSMGPDFWREVPQVLGELEGARVLIVRGAADFQRRAGREGQRRRDRSGAGRS